MRQLAVLLTVGVAVLGAISAEAIARVADGPIPPARVARDPSPSPSGVHITPLSTAKLASDVRAHGEGITIATNGPKSVLVTAITVDPGGSFGWHTHPGPVVVTMRKGTLALYQPVGHDCKRSTLTAHQGFVEGGGDVHLARNEGSTPVKLNATFLARAGTSRFLTPAQEPSACHV